MQVILWTLDNGNTINSLELDNSNSECYYFERLERVLATQVTNLTSIRNMSFSKIFVIIIIIHSVSVNGQATLESGEAEAEV